MKRWLSTTFIVAYLGALSLGIAAQTMSFGHTAHPFMYYFVWDMFCGWSSYEIRYHVVGQGESGAVYELSPGPWKKFMPYGDLPRAHYDTLGQSLAGMGLNALKRTEHEPIHRIMMIEEVWPKQYNMSDRDWAARSDEPKDPMPYYWKRFEMTPEGTYTYQVREYGQYLQQSILTSNPKFMEDIQRGKDHYMITPSQRVAAVDKNN